MPEATTEIFTPCVWHIGSRGSAGQVPGLEGYRQDLSLVTFDADPSASVNAESVASWRSVRMENCAVSGKDGRAILHVTASPTLSSIQQPLPPWGAVNQHLGRCDLSFGEGLESEANIEVPTRSVDSLCAEGLPTPNWLTIDTQGHEMEILSGAQQALNDSVAGITLEVSFIEMYDQTPDVGDIHSFMTIHGFDLVAIKPIHAHRSRNPFAWRGRSSILMADFTYLRTVDHTDWQPSLRYMHAFIATVVGCTDTTLRILQNLKHCNDPMPDLGRITRMLQAFAKLGAKVTPDMPSDWLHITSGLSANGGGSDWDIRESNEFGMVQGSKEIEAFLHSWGLPASAAAVKEYREGFLDHVPAELWGGNQKSI